MHNVFNNFLGLKVERIASLKIEGLAKFWRLEEIAIVVLDIFKLHVERIHQRGYHVEGQPLEIELFDECIIAKEVGLKAL